MGTIKNYLINSTKLILAGIILMSSCTNSEKTGIIKFHIKNNTQNTITDYTLGIHTKEIIEGLNNLKTDNINVIIDGKSQPYQVIDTDKDNTIDKFLILVSLNPKEEKEVTIKKNKGEKPDFVKRTQAELSIKEGGKWVEVTKKSGDQQFEYQGGKFKNVSSLQVPDNHTDHSYYIRYEGPGWESDKIGYRIYLDWRNAVDIFSKRTTAMVLQNVGQDGFDSYHEFSEWGMDILKVGNSLGIGSIGYWDGNNAVRVAVTDSTYCEIVENGILNSVVKIKYYGWKDPGRTINLKSHTSISAGSRISWLNINLSDVLDNLCTGIVKHEKGELILSEESDNDWAFIATYGKQSVNDDNLGMFIFYKKSDLIQQTEDLHSHVIVLNPAESKLLYGFGAVWEKDTDEIKTKKQFVNYLNQELDLLNKPIEIIN